ncbi:protein of unknown function [Paenibacillus sp. 1_12]|uniref:DUF960 family protein n=1 Tax=Paenibacillus sp. 1_12 TaxID=1566278 RepID=UPI0008EFBD0C|nr:DUF960 family protein [Paenibacillus sp. 1_12]SFM25194.1 protein of unknown function [Paenibacillus sp. 1_12]
MTLKFAPRGATNKVHKIIPFDLQLHLFRLIDSQIEQGLEMDHWQFFELQKTNLNQLLITHSQNNPPRKEKCLLDGYSLAQDYIEAWAIDYEELGATLMIADPA